MTETEPTAGPPVSRDVWIVALLAAALFLPGLGLRDLWNPDEARYAEVAREMAATGSWAVPQLNGETYTHKPPLFFWAIAASGFVTGGLSEADARVPSALGALGAVVLVFLLGHRLFGRRAAWLSALAFGTCFQVFHQARFGQIDMLLTFWVTLAVWCWVESEAQSSALHLWSFYVVTGWATLTKGPVGLLPPLLAILAYLLWTRDREGWKRLKVGRGLLLWAAVVAAWLVPAALEAGVPYLEQIVYKQNVTRYANPWHHFRPWYYYLTVIPGSFFPWSVFLPAGVWVAWRHREHRGFRLTLCWIAVTVLFFSISPAKRSVYVLTCFPALGLWIGATLDRALETWPRFRRAVTWPFGLVAGIALAIAVALPFVAPDRWGRELAILGAPMLWILCVGLTALGLGALWGAWAGRRGCIARAVGSLAVGMVVFELCLGLYLFPRLDAFKSARGLSEELVDRLEPGQGYGIFQRFDAGFIFYTGRFQDELDTPEKLRAYARRPERVWVLVERDAWRALDDRPRLWEVARDADAVDGYLLMTNRAPAREP